MKQKFLLSALLILVATSMTFAQKNPTPVDQRTEMDLFQSTLGMSKKDFEARFVEIPDAKVDKFWNLYNKYEDERQMQSEKRIALGNRYMDLMSMDNVDEKDEAKLMKEVIALQKSSDNNITKYYNMIKAQVGVKTAMQFYQVEQYLRSTIDGRLYGNLPIQGSDNSDSSN